MLVERVRSNHPGTGDIDITWELEATEVRVVDNAGESLPRPRARMATLRDEDPVRYYMTYQRTHARDSQPSVPRARESELTDMPPIDHSHVMRVSTRPTLYEEDPAGYDLAYRREHADSIPTLPDIG